MYIPKSANAENKCPVIVAAHGWTDSAEKTDAVGIEMSRRGVAVISIDGYSHGLSSNTDGIIIAQAGMDGLGMVAVMKYLQSGILDYIDLDRVGIFGHSMGGSIVGGTLATFGEAYAAAYETATSPDSEEGVQISESEQAALNAAYPVQSAFIMGNMDETVTMCFDTLRCNVAVEIGSREELTVEEYETWLNGEHKEGFFGYANALALLRTIEPDATDVAPNTFYGSKENNTLRIYYETLATHPSTMIVPRAIANIIAFFTTTFDLPADLGPTSQVHLLKRTCNFIAMIGLLLFIFPLSASLIETPSFVGLKGQTAEKLPALNGKSKRWFWIGFAINSAVSVLIAFITHWTYNAPWFYSVFPAHLWVSTPLFSCDNLNCLLTWIILNAVWMAIWTGINLAKDKEHTLKLSEILNLKTSGKSIWKALLMAVSVVCIVYVIVFTAKWLLGTDFRFYQAAIKVFKPSILLNVLAYFPFILLGNLATSVFVNGFMRYEGMSETKSILLCSLASVIGVVVIVAIQYGGLFINGFVGLSGNWGAANYLAMCLWLFAIAPVYHRFFYNLTGKNWLGPLTFALLFTINGVANTCISSPLF